MEFNIQKYLTENKLTGQSQMREDDNTDLTMHIGDDYEDMMQHDDDEEEEDMDDWSTSDSYDGNYDQEPTAQDIAKPEPALTGIHKKQAQLQALEAQKDALLMQYKSGQLGLDQYKEKIGNIPNQIKKLRADVDKAMTVTADDGSEDEMA
jgi:hypothetical protein